MLADGLLATTDTLVEGLDWRPEWSTPADVGWKAVMVNVSDISAMGGRTEHLLVSVVVGPAFDVDGFYDGVVEACATVGCAVVGGDLSGGEQTVVSITALGRAAAPVRRSGAHPGDAVFVSGPLGGAARDLRGGGGGAAHRRPVAYLGSVPVGVTAMIDVSDGLVADCNHIAEASRVGIALDGLWLAEGATDADALFGGDDYVLVACGGDGAEGWRRIGVCVEGDGITWRGERLDPKGWEHAL